MSSDLVWQLVRNNNCFLVKRNGVTFSREAGNLLNKHSFKYSGLVKKAVDVSEGSIALKIASKTRKPAKNIRVNKLNKSARAASAGIKKNLQYYRPDLTEAAIARVSRLQQTKKPVKAAAPKKVRGAKAKKASA